jgi:UDP-2,4-diacetamido-2,4,6-trideoxy-beta-L-altropyranose hydrolase
VVPKSSPERVAFVLDSGGDVGWGHFVRCSALAVEFTQRGCEVMFIVNGEPPPFAAAEASPALDGRADIVVFDLHPLTPSPDPDSWDEALIVCIADGAVPPYRHDILVDPNVGAPAGNPPHRLAGAPYVILRPQFDHVSAPRIRESPERLLVSFGGTIQPDLLERVSAAIEARADAFLTVELMLPRPVELEIPARIAVRSAVRDIERLLAGADAGLIAAGGTMHEACAMGIPCAVVSLTEDQAGEAEALAAREAVLYLGNAERVTDSGIGRALAELAGRSVRERLSRAGRQVIDRQGRRRVVAAILQAAGRR